MKPGIVTSEFWLTVVGLALTNLGIAEVPRKHRGFVSLGLVGAYTLSRGMAKCETPPPPVVGSALPEEPVDPLAVEMAEQRAAGDADRIPEAI